jgi:histidine phosphotransferase ChpT
MMESSRLASYLASRIFHDLVSPLTAIINGEELAFDASMGPAIRAEGEKLIRDGLNGLNSKIQFLRYALGSQAVNDDWADVNLARDLFEKLFASHKASLLWKVETRNLTNRQMRLLMNMALVGMEPAAKNASVLVAAREEGATIVLEVAASGVAALKKDAEDAMAGREPDRGWSGGAIQPLFTRMLADEIGFSLQGRTGEAGAGLIAKGLRAA